jgi:hypothetical protein
MYRNFFARLNCCVILSFFIFTLLRMIGSLLVANFSTLTEKRPPQWLCHLTKVLQRRIFWLRLCSDDFSIMCIVLCCWCVSCEIIDNVNKSCSWQTCFLKSVTTTNEADACPPRLPQVAPGGFLDASAGSLGEGDVQSSPPKPTTKRKGLHLITNIIT